MIVPARETSCREVVAAYLARIGQFNPRDNTIVSLRDADALLCEADARDAQLAREQSLGWMHGIPQAIKDLANATGLPARLGSPLMRNFVLTHDSLVVARMKAAGCIVIGKTNLPEFGPGLAHLQPKATLNKFLRWRARDLFSVAPIQLERWPAHSAPSQQAR